MKYKFVLKDKGTYNQGWWLKIDNADQLADYHEKVMFHKIAAGYESVLHSKEFGYGEKHVNPMGMYMGKFAENHRLSLLTSAVNVHSELLQTQMNHIRTGYNLYFNRNGGWNYGNDDYSDWCERNDLVFPDFTKSDIRIKQFPMGRHYYAYIGSMQVRDGDQLKWNTYDEAYKYAKDIIYCSRE